MKDAFIVSEANRYDIKGRKYIGANSKYYIQSAYTMESKEKQTQEKKSLLNIDDSFRKIIVVKDNFKAHYDEKRILLISLKEFLLDLNILNKY